jgi:serine/threonine protein kinase
MVGQTLAHYKILEKIGSGGMGNVYLSRRHQVGPEGRAEDSADGAC